MQRMTCDDYLENLWATYGFSSLISELYWSGGCDVDVMWKYMRSKALCDDIELIDASTWDYDSAMYSCYKNDDDKALS